jgi:RNA polymerase sigma-70 factor (ECF subfamily)
VSEVAIEPYVELVQRAQAGDRHAAGAVCLRFAPAVRSFARRRLATSDAVDEFTQDVMLVLVEALGSSKLEAPERLPGFVLGICKNFARDRVRQRERREALWNQYAADLAELTPAVPEQPTYEIMHLEDCLSSLSKRAREVVRLAYSEAASPKQIADQLALSEGNARVLRHRSLLALRECMSKRISWEAA